MGTAGLIRQWNATLLSRGGDEVARQCTPLIEFALVDLFQDLIQYPADKGGISDH